MEFSFEIFDREDDRVGFRVEGKVNMILLVNNIKCVILEVSLFKILIRDGNIVNCFHDP